MWCLDQKQDVLKESKLQVYMLLTICLYVKIAF